MAERGSLPQVDNCVAGRRNYQHCYVVLVIWPQAVRLGYPHMPLLGRGWGANSSGSWYFILIYFFKNSKTFLLFCRTPWPYTWKPPSPLRRHPPRTAPEMGESNGDQRNSTTKHLMQSGRKQVKIRKNNQKELIRGKTSQAK